MRFYGYELKLTASDDDGEIDVSSALNVGRLFSHQEFVVREDLLVAIIRGERTGRLREEHQMNTTAEGATRSAFQLRECIAEALGVDVRDVDVRVESKDDGEWTEVDASIRIWSPPVP